MDRVVPYYFDAIRGSVYNGHVQVGQRESCSMQQLVQLVNQTSRFDIYQLLNPVLSNKFLPFF